MKWQVYLIFQFVDGSEFSHILNSKVSISLTFYVIIFIPESETGVGWSICLSTFSFSLFILESDNQVCIFYPQNPYKQGLFCQVLCDTVPQHPEPALVAGTDNHEKERNALGIHIHKHENQETTEHTNSLLWRFSFHRAQLWDTFHNVKR